MMAELCGTCCKGSQPIRKRFDDPIVCACGAPFFSQIVVENSLPTSRRCRIGIPIDFMEDHGSKFDKTVTLQAEEEDMEVHRVQIGGNLFVGFGFEWKDFAQAHNIGIGQVVVFTLVARSRYLVQIYKLDGNPSSSSKAAAKPQTSSANAPPTGVPPPLVTPKVEDDDDDVIEVCAAQDWLVAKASRSNPANGTLPSKVKAEEVLSETGSRQPAARAPDNHGRGQQSVIPETICGQAARATNKDGRVELQKCVIVPKTENGVDDMDVSDGIVEASDSSLRKKTFGGADFEVMHEGHVRKTPVAEEEEGQASPREGCSSDNEENGESNVSSPSTSDSVWSPGRSYSPHVRKRGGAAAQDEPQRKRSRSMKSRSEADDHSEADDDEMNAADNKNPLLVVGQVAKRHGHDWHKAGTKRGRTYVSKRRPVTEVEADKTLKKALQVHVDHPSFLKQLRKDCCYRSLILDPPIEFYRENMVSATNGSYKATLIDQEGKTWSTRIMGMKIFWKHFTLDHYLEEDDVVVFELTDPRPESVTFLVHIFRVVDVKMTLTGKEGWAIHYNVVEGTKKQYFEERRRLLKARGLKKLRKQNKNKTRKDLGSPNPNGNESGITGYFRRKKKNSERSPTKSPKGKGKGVQEELHASDELEQQQPQALRSFRRPTTRLRRQEINQSQLNNITTPSKSKSAGCVKQEIEEEAPPLAASLGMNLIQGNIAVNSVSTEPCVLKEVFAGEGLSD